MNAPPKLWTVPGVYYPVTVLPTPQELRRREYNRKRMQRIRAKWKAAGLNSRGKARVSVV